MTSLTTAIQKADRRLPLIDDPEVREALQNLTAQYLEQLRDEYDPIVSTAQSLPTEIEMMPITNETQLAVAEAWLLKRHVPVGERVKELIGPPKGFGRRIWQLFLDLEKLVTEPHAKARDIYNTKVKAYGAAVERERKRIEEEARKAREEADRQAREEHERAVRAAEEKAAAEKQQRERELEEQRKAAESAGDTQAAAALEAEREQVQAAPIVVHVPVTAPVVLAPVMAPKKPGGLAKHWKGRPKGDTDEERDASFLKAARFAVEHPEFIGILQLDQGTVDTLAKAHEAKLEQIIPGIEGYNDQKVAKPRGR